MQLSVMLAASEVILLWCCSDWDGSRWYRVCCGLFNIRSNSWSSVSCNSWSKSGKSGGQKPHRLLRLRNASTRWWSVAVVNPLHAGDAYVSRHTTTARKTACRPISVMLWCCSMRSAYSDCALSLITQRIWSDAYKVLATQELSYLTNITRFHVPLPHVVYVLHQIHVYLLQKVRTNLVFTDRSFSRAVSTVWNALLQHVFSDLSNLTSFKRLLKTQLCNRALTNTTADPILKVFPSP